MPRPQREEVAGGIHHVFARGNRRGALFLSADDYNVYLALLGGIAKTKKWRVLAYCLMPNHVHLLIETPEPNLGSGMQHLHGLYARIFNDEHGLVGHAFQGRFGSKLVRDDAQLLTTARYIAANPVEAGLAATAGEWEWNSFAAVAAGTAPRWLDVERLYEYLEMWGGEPAALLAA